VKPTRLGAGGEDVITEIEIEGFKSLEKVHLKLGGLNLFVGTNASGKSNFFDALRVFQGVGYGFTIDEIFNGRPNLSGTEAWEPIRGGWPWIPFRGVGSLGDVQILLRVVLRLSTAKLGDYRLALSSDHLAVRLEKLEMDSRLLFSAVEIENEYMDLMNVELGGGERKFSLESRGPVLGSLLEEGHLERFDRDAVKACLRLLGNVQRLEPSVPLLRDYTRASRATRRMGEKGENFAGLIKTIIAERDLRSDYVSWLRQLTPTDLEDIAILEGALGEPLFAIRAGGNIIPAPSLSDGTLRFAALVAAFFQPDMPDIITIEELENGIHPSRLRLLLELLKSQSGGSNRPGPQVFATTHSPLVLSWLEESDYATTFVCKRDEETGASIIKPLSEIPLLGELAKKQPIGDLFAEGWLEGVF
jgi:hypothetical protein